MRGGVRGGVRGWWKGGVRGWCEGGVRGWCEGGGMRRAVFMQQMFSWLMVCP